MFKGTGMAITTDVDFFYCFIESFYKKEAIVCAIFGIMKKYEKRNDKQPVGLGILRGYPG
ncbi:hypothetical protein J2S09_003935 [Bacillus fengqiuensis]|nr:hypothetical protein [Bacillus fengqiuensis]